MTSTPPPARTLPPSAYVDAATYAREVERLFRPGWISVARVDQLEHPGDYVAFDLFGDPLVAVRGDDGQLRAFSRVCRHRWMPVVEAGSGRRRSFQCPYHLWTYGLDGRLLGAPDMTRATGFDRASCALPALRVECWMGWVFVSFDPDPEPLAPRVDALARAIAPYEPERMRTLEPLVFEHDWNWKILVENFLESYHHQGPHSQTLQPLVPASGTWAEDADGPFAILRNPTRDGAPLPALLPVAPGLSAAQRAEFVVGAIFPFHLLSAQPDGLLWYRLEPLAVDRFRLSIYPCVPAGTEADPAHAEAIATMRSFVDTIHREDIVACQGVQDGVRATLARPGFLSPLEKAVEQMGAWWRARMEA